MCLGANVVPPPAKFTAVNFASPSKRGTLRLLCLKALKAKGLSVPRWRGEGVVVLGKRWFMGVCEGVCVFVS